MRHVRGVRQYSDIPILGKGMGKGLSGKAGFVGPNAELGGIAWDGNLEA